MPYPASSQLRERILMLRQALPSRLECEIAELAELENQVYLLDAQEVEDWALDVIVRIRFDDHLGRHADFALRYADELETELARHRLRRVEDSAFAKAQGGVLNQVARVTSPHTDGLIGGQRGRDRENPRALHAAAHFRAALRRGWRES